MHPQILKGVSESLVRAVEGVVGVVGVEARGVRGVGGETVVSCALLLDLQKVRKFFLVCAK